MSQVVRWALIVPAAFVAWYLAFFIGIVLHLGAEAIAPPNQMMFGYFVPWLDIARYSAVVIGAALAAALVMVACTFLAPTHRREVAVASFVIGSLVAVFMGWSIFRGPMVAAIATGAVVLAVLLRRLPLLSPSNKTLERMREG
jgi:hypothetical protein